MQADYDLPILIVSGSAEHAYEWSRLRADLWPSRSSGYHHDEITAILKQDSNEVFGFVAQLSDGTLAGFAEASVRRDYVNGCSSSPVLFLEGIYVDPTYRRQGIGWALFDAVRSEGRSFACAEFASDTAIDDIGSQAFHKALGFEETERVVFFRQTL